MSRLLDLSHAVTAGMVTYKGLPGPVIRDHLSREASRALYASGTSFQIGRIEMVANTGTYVDAPSHRWEDGADLSGLPLDVLAGRDGVLIAAPNAHGLAVDEDFLEGEEGDREEKENTHKDARASGAVVCFRSIAKPPRSPSSSANQPPRSDLPSSPFKDVFSLSFCRAINGSASRSVETCATGPSR